MFSSENSSLSGDTTRPVLREKVTGLDLVHEACVIKQVSDVVPWDNQDNLIPKQAEVMVKFLVTVVFLPLCFLVSLSTNLVNIGVFCKLGLKERVNMCLFSLSVLDLLYVVVVYGMHASVPHMFAIGQEDTIEPSMVFFFETHLIGFLNFGTAP
ncbi:hypothetical protein ACOMHN_007397 [Nucella lapillus]